MLSQNFSFEALTLQSSGLKKKKIIKIMQLRPYSEPMGAL